MSDQSFSPSVPRFVDRHIGPDAEAVETLLSTIGVTSLERVAFLPDLPSINETVAPNFLVETWNGVMAPAKTPEVIINKVSDVLLKMADDPEVKEQMRKAGSSTVKSTPAQFRAQIEQEMAQWKPLVAEILAKEAAKEKTPASRN